MTMRNTKITNRWGKFLCAALAAGAIASAALPARADERRPRGGVCRKIKCFRVAASIVTIGSG